LVEAEAPCRRLNIVNTYSLHFIVHGIADWRNRRETESSKQNAEGSERPLQLAASGWNKSKTENPKFAIAYFVYSSSGLIRLREAAWGG
jgi:hypothetical protein